jgi:hypothetical protein
MPNFNSIAYLLNGNEKQKLAHRVLTSNSIFERLREFDPFLAGTVPINIDIDGSDLDIICCWKDKHHFIQTLSDHFSGESRFQIRKLKIRNIETVVANFFIEPFPIEVFGQNRPVKEQEAYRHMFIEHKILEERGENFRQEVIKLKKSGVKTEVAFARLLGLDERDAYDSLLNYTSV